MYYFFITYGAVGEKRGEKELTLHPRIFTYFPQSRGTTLEEMC